MSHSYKIRVMRRTATACVVAISILGCTHAARTASFDSRRPAFAAAGALLDNISFSARSIETETISLALDRIDQRELPLDKTYRRAGTGRGVTVYIFDGGILASHPELAGRVRKGYDGFATDPAVCNAHGTAVAGAVGGKSLGVAPDAEIVDVKMVECSKLRGTIKAIVEGTAWVIADYKRHGRPAVANWSFIADTISHIPALDTAVAQLRAAGIPVIVSAGNIDINACRVSPGNADGAIVVGATMVVRDVANATGSARLIDRRVMNTAWGPCVDVYAPGDSVLLPSFDATQTPSVQLWNGTSMSAGYVSGAVALFLESRPQARPEEALAYLRGTATMNVIRDARSPFSWLLYVGPIRPDRETTPSVGELRAAMARRP